MKRDSVYVTVYECDACGTQVYREDEGVPNGIHLDMFEVGDWGGRRYQIYSCEDSTTHIRKAIVKARERQDAEWAPE
jgi:hypothetical protein